MKSLKKEAQLLKRKLKNSYFTSIVSLSLVLFVIGMLGLLILNAAKLSTHVKENIGFSIMLKNETKQQEINQLQEYLNEQNYVKQTSYISKEKAAQELREELGENFVEFLGYNPLLASIDVKVYEEYSNIESILKIKNALEKRSEVKEVFFQESVIDLVNKNLAKMGVVIFIFSLLLALIAVALLNNTVRLSIYSKRFSINTMKLVGATNNFIIKPFINKSILHGIIAGFVAIFMLTFLIYFAPEELTALVDLNNVGFLFFGIIVFGTIINSLTTYFAVRKYLHLDIDELYF